ncbi:MAG: hypothetical protein IJI15_01185 [Atopobiaceae bacterium]|nr:hypothetical protein [Atopobiaceae bacterium]
MAIPKTLMNALRPVTLVVGHYGVGKTNFSVNLAIDLVAAGKQVTLIDLDIVNPYFRASEQRRVLEEHGVELVAHAVHAAGELLAVLVERALVERIVAREHIVDRAAERLGLEEELKGLAAGGRARAEHLGSAQEPTPWGRRGCRCTRRCCRPRSPPGRGWPRRRRCAHPRRAS